MKKDIHPKYNDKIKVSCACGHSFETGSTQPEIKVDLCSNCHPFYTGKQKLVDTARRAEKFNAKVSKKETTVKAHKSKTSKLAAKTAKRSAKSK